MKPHVLAIACLLVGSVLGIGESRLRIAPTRPTLLEQRPVDHSDATVRRRESNGPPRATVLTEDGSEGGSQIYHFGVMDRSSVKSHSFRLKNTGGRPLKLWIESTTCKCAVGNLESGEIQPGDDTLVTLEWRPKDYEFEFMQTATIGTNDPGRPEVAFSVEGRVRQLVRPVPSDLKFPRIGSNTESTQVQFRLFNYQNLPLKITSHQFLNPDNAEFFEAKFSPLSPEDVTHALDATGGILTTITLKPGIGRGRFSQTLSISTNVSQAPTFEIPLEGNIERRISVYGSDINREHNLLKVGTIQSTAKIKKELKLFIREKGRESAKVEITEIDPADVMQVKLGKAIVSSKVVIYPLTVTIQPSGQQIRRLGNKQGQLASFVVRTNRSNVNEPVDELKVYVRFAVVD